jgi:protein phosphatase
MHVHLIISDAHANYDALVRILESVRYDSVMFLGDSVDYGPQPAETLDLLREVGSIILKGNHDAVAAHGISYRCAEELRPLSEYTREKVAMKFLSKEDLIFLTGLPEKVEIEVDGKRIYAVHASPRNHLYGYVMPDISDEQPIDEHLRSKNLPASAVESVKGSVVISRKLVENSRLLSLII